MLTDFLGANRAEGLTIVAGKASLPGATTCVPILHLPAGTGGWPHMPHHPRAPPSGSVFSAPERACPLRACRRLSAVGAHDGLYVGAPDGDQPVSRSGYSAPP